MRRGEKVVKELKATVYRPAMAVLGSRNQYCIHKTGARPLAPRAQRGHSRLSRSAPARARTVSKAEDKNKKCLDLLETHSCKPGRQVNRLRTLPELQPGGSAAVWDVEDLVRLGQREQACPYFGAKQIASESATFVLCPYNYLLDPVVREVCGGQRGTAFPVCLTRRVSALLHRRAWA